MQQSCNKSYLHEVYNLWLLKRSQAVSSPSAFNLNGCWLVYVHFQVFPILVSFLFPFRCWCEHEHPPESGENDPEKQGAHSAGITEYPWQQYSLLYPSWQPPTGHLAGWYRAKGQVQEERSRYVKTAEKTIAGYACMYVCARAVWEFCKGLIISKHTLRYFHNVCSGHSVMFLRNVSVVPLRLCCTDLLRRDKCPNPHTANLDLNLICLRQSISNTSSW